MAKFKVGDKAFLQGKEEQDEDIKVEVLKELGDGRYAVRYDDGSGEVLNVKATELAKGWCL